MKERPILMSTPMVRAILEGRKSQTRRTKGLDFLRHIPFTNGLDEKPYKHAKDGTWCYQLQTEVDDSREYKLRCPYGQPGDILWVRETWTLIDGKFGYRALVTDEEARRYKWKPSIFMPKEACRIMLEVTDVRAERLNDITDDDAKAEGIDYVIDKITGYCGRNYLHGGYNLMITPYHGYRSLWESINGEGSWKMNPWVWVIEFKIMEVKK